MKSSFGCIVIGAGHAGIEAALAPSRMGVATLMINYAFDTVGLMSCNPAIGGVGKGQLVREVDLLGGEMGLAADRTAIQFRQLNGSKGPAVRSSRVQSDRERYRAYMQDVVKRQQGLTFYAGEAAEIMVKGGRVCGVKTVDGMMFEAPCVVVTAGTFLNGRMHLGPKITPGGRIDEKPSLLLARNIEDLGFTLRNFKTGTPPRLDGRTIDHTSLKLQGSDAKIIPFSFRTPGVPAEQKLRPSWQTHTTALTHQIIRDNFHLSPMYSGQIDATGVRYCPSIEDKLKKFGDKESHPVFLEPDGIDTDIVYPNGISTGLPEHVQEEFVRSMPGLEKVAFVRYGYSIEHAVIYAEELKHSLESKRIAGLFFAGQLNGTTGYEEAAVQGMVAGINAALSVRQEEPFMLRRDEAYAGVLIDDLITRGTNEPYRMFTSRVEYRLLVREDNTDERLAVYGRKFGLITEKEYAAIEAKYAAVRRMQQRLKEFSVSPDGINPVLIAANATPIIQKTPAYDILKRPEVLYSHVAIFDEELRSASEAVAARVEYDVKYEGFIVRQRKEVDKFRHLENIRIPVDFDVAAISAISYEVREKLKRFKPETLGQANRISGMTPAAISVLMIYLKKYFAK
ncbi:MAG: tRNA uridine-5-carboxymethylaminomethyl(34) synthesis enzyme MnmG [Candidatus Omnitrophica bacterium]|nr:tRNA uridine-5-carboxymethylaminomethyl(34) synthesis enzyme MnmG [Candidatus Omnitrophota bacterium]